MKSKILIVLMTFVWLVLMANIIYQENDGKWQTKDGDKIGLLEIAQYTDQIIIVMISDEDAKLCFYENIEKTNQGDRRKNWNVVLETEAIIGKNGLGKTKEGDEKTPIGVFRFIEAFGILQNPGTKMYYTQVDEEHYWVDDSDSNYYNQFISRNEVHPDWKHAEHILEYGESYHYVLATSYNIERIPGAGSAVFLHCMSKEAEATAGCIAVPEIYMREIIKRVDPQCVIIVDYIENILCY